MKLFTSILNSRNLALAGVSVLLLPAFAGAQIISLNVRDGNATGNAAVTDPFGVAPEGTVVGNWNNTNSLGAASPTVGLIDDGGNATGVSVTVLNPGGTQYWGADYIKTPWNFGPAMFTGTPNPVSYTFSNLNDAFPLGYYALVYVNGAAANSGAAVTDGTTTFYFKSSDTANTTPILITTTTQPDPGEYTAGNYTKFGSMESALTSDTITFTIPTGSIQSNNAGIGGVQLVAIPEPSTYALFAGIAVLGLLVYRRRRA